MVKNMEEIYISTDIESDGPIPGKYSMLNFGSVAITKSGEILGTFEANLKALPGAIRHPDTMKFWSKFPDIWKLVTTNPRDPHKVMIEYNIWLKSLEDKGKLVFVAYPSGFDFTFIRWYMEYFTDDCIFGYQCLDIKSYAMAKLGVNFTEATKSKFPEHWFDRSLKHTHSGIDDAISQGVMFIKMLNDIG